MVSGIGFLGAGVIMRDGGGISGLNTAATLWCSAALGVLAASGHLAFALLLTLAVLGVHILLRPAGRLLDRAPAAGNDKDADIPATVHVECDRSAETHIRALLLQALTASGLAPTALRAHRRESGTTSLRAPMTVSGDITRALEQVVGRLSLEPGTRNPEPGTRNLHWHLDGSTDTGDSAGGGDRGQPVPYSSEPDSRCATR
ncbi:MgtC/SapB family protein [Streptomyces sp. NPDC050516]|uniref:MgtC/SapB family protein n=1 Tax=Streptomyces sp. NPDC050516 TaxID=3365621 RepID=UPI00379D9EEB